MSRRYLVLLSAWALSILLAPQANAISPAEAAKQIKGTWDLLINYQAGDGNLHVHLDFTGCNSATDCTVVVQNQEPESGPLSSPPLPVAIDDKGVIRFFQNNGPAQELHSNSCAAKFWTNGGDYVITLLSDGTLRGDVYVHAGKKDHCGAFTGGTKLPI